MYINLNPKTGPCHHNQCNLIDFMNIAAEESAVSLPLKVYMLGSGAIAVPVLSALMRTPGVIELVGVGTQPDRPAGRSQLPVATPVGAFAAAAGFAPDKWDSVNDGRLEAKLRGHALDFMVVVSFGQLLKKPLLELPRFGCVNVHASLLPRYRGASPIVHAIANGDAETGVSFMDMEPGLDCGKVYRQLRRNLDGTESAATLEIALGELAAGRMVEVLEAVAQGELPGAPQNPAAVTVTRKIRKSDGDIDWNLSAAAIEARVRAYAPWPGAGFTLPLAKGAQRLILTRARVVPSAGGVPGEIIQADRRGWVTACGRDALELLEVVPPGKKPMAGVNFLNGRRENLTGMRLITEPVNHG